MQIFHYGNFEISIFNSINDELIKKKWGAFENGNLNVKYLSFIEDSNPKDLEFLYVIIERLSGEERVICGLLYFQNLKFTKKNIHIRNFVLNWLVSFFLIIRPFKILICGNLFAVSFPSIKYDRKNITRKEIIEIVSMIISNIKSDAILLKDLEDEFTKEEMTENGWQSYLTDLTMTLDIKPEWNSFNDYKNSLSKKYRKRADKIIEAGKNLVQVELGEIEIEKNLAEIEKLFKQVVAKQTFRMGLIKPQYFLEFKKRFPEKFSLYGYMYQQKLIAFATYIDHGKTLEVHYIGIDYSFNKDFLLYFNILSDSVEKAIMKKKEHLELGRTAREAKASLGSKPVFFNDYVKLKSKTALRLTKLLSRYFIDDMGESWKERNPL